MRNKLPQKFPGQLDCLKLPKFVGFSNWSSLLDSEIGGERGIGDDDDDDVGDIEYDHDHYNYDDDDDVGDIEYEHGDYM